MATIEERLARMRQDAGSQIEASNREQNSISSRLNAMRSDANRALSTQNAPRTIPLMDLAVETVTQPTVRKDNHDVLLGIEAATGRNAATEYQARRATAFQTQPITPSTPYTVEDMQAELKRLQNERAEGSAAYASGDVTEAMAQWDRQKQIDAQIADLQTKLKENGVEQPNPLAAGHGAFWRGMSNFEQRTYQGLDFLNRMVHQYVLGMSPEEYESENTLTRQLSQHGGQNVATWDEYTRRNQGDSKAAEIGTQLISETVAALPYSIMAIMSGGASLAGEGTAGLMSAANAASATGKIASAANSARTAVAAMVQDPQYWFTVLQEVGGSYENAKANGADEDKAVLYATVNSLANALVEIGGGGIQELPQQLRSGSGQAVRLWVDSMIDEGKEEVIQGVIERGLEILYGKQNKVFSTTDPDAIFNPITAGKEFGMGAAVGGILGSGQLGVNLAQNALGGRTGGIGENIVNIPPVNEGLWKLAEEMAAEEIAKATPPAPEIAPVTPPVTQTTGEIIQAPKAAAAATEGPTATPEKKGGNFIFEKPTQVTAEQQTQEETAKPQGNVAPAAKTQYNNPVETAPKAEAKAVQTETPAEAQAEDRKPHERLSDALLQKLKNEETITAKDLATLAEQAYGGTRAEGAYDIKSAYDSLELAVNRYLVDNRLIRESANGDVYAAERTVNYLNDLLSNLPTQTVRTEEQQQFQQFSTPPNIAYLAAWAANIGKNDVILEPSAGIGGLALWGKAWGGKVYGNELSQRRAEILRTLGLDEVFTENAEQINNVLPDYVQPSVVLMNPPFSATAGRTATNSTANAKRHIEQALDRLNDGGRLVAILGRGMSNDSKTFSRWWDDLRKEYDIRANLSINGENYKKYGTTFDVQLVVIDKTGPQKGQTVTGEFTDLTEIPKVLEGIRNDRTELEGSPAPAAGRSAERGNQSVRSDGRDGGEQGRSSGGNERVAGNRSASERGTGEAGTGNGRREQPGRAGEAGSGVAEGGNVQRVGESGGEAAGGAAAESPAERGARPESELPEQGLTPPKTPRKTTATKAAANDDGVFTEYQPPATPVKGAKKHPAVLVESAAMGAVQSPEAVYKPKLPKEIISSGKLSDAQISNIVYAGQAHSQMIPMQNKRKGYFIGDGTGVGKGRQISGIILDNFQQGRKKALWISKGQDLFPDAMRDWTDIGGNAEDMFSLSKIKADAPVQAKNGIMFTTYDTLAAQSKSKKSRLDQIVDWLGKDFDGVIAFDEAHNMGNLLGKKAKFGASKPAQKAIAGNELQQRLPKARVVYVSATMATDVNEMAFADRLGLWGLGTQFSDVNDFVNKISRGGIAAMELVARDMKAMGVYQARSISYNGVEYETLQHDLTPMQKEIYDTLSRAWQVTLQHMNDALDMTGGNLNGQARAAAKSAYYGAMQRFYNQIITSMAVPSVIQDMKKELDAGRSVVLQIVNTNEAETNRQLAAAKESGASLDDLDITPREALLSFLRKSFPTQAYEEYTDENGTQRSRPVLDSNGKPVQDKKAVAMRERMIAEVEQMSVPEGPLEMIFDAFGVDQVAEVTGRKRRLVPGKDDYGSSVKVEEKRSDKSNEADVQAFQDGKKRILIFSDAGGTGKSYHADKRAKNQQQRVHYLLQPGWSAPKAVQGFGRTHRSNEVSAPIYKLVTTDVRGQKRFVSTIARRLDQLGALTKGQRQTGSGMFSAKDNLESDLAMDSLWSFYRQLGANKLEGLDGETILAKLGLADKFHDEWGNFHMNDVVGRDMNTFLNRIMALEYDEQNAVFDAFSRIFDDEYDKALSDGTLDMGMETVRADKIEILDDTVIRTDEATGATTNYVQAKLSEKTRILQDIEDLRMLRGDFLGLYKKENGHVYGVFRTADKTLANGSVVKQYILQTPQQGVASKYVESTFKNEMTRVPEKQWAKAWAEEVKQAPTHKESVRHMLTGTLLPIWNRLPDSGNVRVQRLIADDGRQYLGRIIPPSQIDGVLKSLGAKGRTKQSYTPEQVTKEVFEKGNKAVLQDNRVTLTRRRVGNEWRIEISGNNLWYLKKNVPEIYTEYIGYQERYFVPNGEKQQATVDAILKLNPLKDIEEVRAGTDDSRGPDQSKPGSPASQWETSRVGNSERTPKGLSEIMEGIRHDFGLNITTGHIRGSGVLGQYNPQDHGIRTKSEDDLATATHELGHYFERTYDITGNMPADAKKEIVSNLDPEFAANYPEKKLPREGVAEFLRRYLKNSEEAANDYPEFTKYFLNAISGPDEAKIMTLADEVNAYFALGGDTASDAVRRLEEGRPDVRTVGEKIKDKYHNFYQAWIDSNHGIKLFDRATGANTYKLATNAAYADKRAGQAILGMLFSREGDYVGPGLKSCFAGNEKYLTDTQLYDALGEYLVVKHGTERLAEGKDVFADPRKNRTAWMNKRAAELEAQHPELEEISERLYDFQKQFLQTWGVDTGLVSQKSADEWAERWQYYVPFNRVIPKDGGRIGAKRGFANQDSTIKMSRGSKKAIINPVDNIITNIVKMVNAGVRNGVMQRIYRFALDTGDANFAEIIPALVKKKTFDMRGVKAELKNKVDESGITDATEIYGIIDGLDDILEQYGRGKAYGDIVTVLVDGKPKYLKINDPLLLQSITNMAPKKLEGVLDAYAQVSRFMMSNITGNNILWSLFSNFPRDIGSFFTYLPGSKNPIKAFAAMGSSYINKFKGDRADPLFMEYLSMGGGENSAYTADRDLAKRARDKLLGKKISANPLDWIAFTSDMIEMGPRYATYKLMRDNGMSPQEAFYEAMDVTTNFRRGGRLAREVNKVVPFFNAGVQGLDKFARWITAEEAPEAERNKVRRGRMIGFIAVSAAIAAAFYALNNWDDEKKHEYAKESNYTKNSYWLFPLYMHGEEGQKYFAIPKPREIAVLSSFFEACMEYGIGENNHAFDEFYQYAVDTCLPNVAADLAQGDWQGAIDSLGIVGIGAYLMANRDFLGKPIESAGMQYLEPKDRYNERTSKIAYAIGQAFNVSPQKVDYFFSQVLGGWWKSQKALFPVGGENVDYTLGIQNSYIKDNLYSNDIVNRLYDMAEKSQQAKNSDPGDIDKAISAKRDSNMTTFYSRYNSISKNSSGTASRGTRNKVIETLYEYEKAAEANDYTRAEKAVLDVVRAAGDTGTYMPSVMNTVVKDGNGKQHSLSDVQYVEYQTDYLRIYYEIIEDALPAAKNAAERAAIVKHAKETAKNTATDRTLARIAAPAVKDKYGSVSDKNVTIFTGLKDIYDDDMKDQEAVIAAIERMQKRNGLSDADAYTLFHSQYDSDKNNPWA